jgi:hypothetical protein
MQSKQSLNDTYKALIRELDVEGLAINHDENTAVGQYLIAQNKFNEELERFAGRMPKHLEDFLMENTEGKNREEREKFFNDINEGWEEQARKKAKEMFVNHPPHYCKGGIECIDALKASMPDEAFKGFLKGNVIKYVWRYEDKSNPLEDLEKAEWYLKKLISELKNS